MKSYPFCVRPLLPLPADNQPEVTAPKNFHSTPVKTALAQRIWGQEDCQGKGNVAPKTYAPMLA